MNTNSSTLTLKDPLEELPEEIFSLALSFLPPCSIAYTTALSRKWRTIVHSHKALHREVDLSVLGKDQIIAISRHFPRLSALSSNTLVKVTLNMTSFWQEWVENDCWYDGSMVDHEQVNLLSFHDLFYHLHLSQETLQKIFLCIDHFQDEVEQEELDSPLEFVLFIMEKLKAFPKLKKIEIAAPVQLLLMAEAPSSAKRFALDNSAELFNTSIDQSQIIYLLREVKKFTQDGFTEFSLLKFGGGEEDDQEAEEDSEVLQELESSTHTMQHLDLLKLQVFDDLNVWHFATQCHNLVSLRLWLFGSNVDQEQEQPQPHVQVSESIAECISLIDLDLTINKYSVDWNSIARWVGSGLTKLRLELDVKSCTGAGILSDGPFGSVIFNSRETIKHLDLSNIHHEVELGGKRK